MILEKQEKKNTAMLETEFALFANRPQCSTLENF